MINPEGTEEQNTSTAGQEWQTMANEVLAKNANESHEAAPVRVDLVTPEYDEKFRNAELYVKKAEVQAEPVTQEGLESGAYANMGVKYDAEQGKYYIETIVMRNKRNADGTVTRYAATENPHDVEPGQWLVTNPIIEPGDAPNIYPVEEADFRKKYIPTDKEGVYQTSGKGYARIIKNETGSSVTVRAPWGEVQNGDEFCYFCAVCEDDTEEGISPDNRYVLSENDAAFYVPVSKAETEA